MSFYDGDKGELTVGEGLRLITPTEMLQHTKPVNDLWVQISVARSFPRNVESFLSAVERDTCTDLQIAMACSYMLKRGKTEIVGPSVRFAESLLRAWGNVRVSTGVVDDSGDHVIVRARFWDLESNMAFEEEVCRRLTDKDGNRYTADVVISTKNAAQAIGFRNVVLAGIPESMWRPIWEKANKFVEDQARIDTEFENKRTKLLMWFRRQGATVQELTNFLGGNPEQCSREEFIRLERLGAAIHQGTQTIEDAFGRNIETEEPSEPRTSRTQNQKPQAKTQTTATEGGSAWTPDRIAALFDPSDASKQANAIMIAIEAEAMNDITFDQLLVLAKNHCSDQRDVAGALLVGLLTAADKDVLTTASQAVHQAKSRKQIPDELHRSLAGLASRRQRTLKRA